MCSKIRSTCCRSRGPFLPIAEGSSDHLRASQMRSKRQRLPVFEPAGVIGARIETILIFYSRAPARTDTEIFIYTHPPVTRVSSLRCFCEASSFTFGNRCILCRHGAGFGGACSGGASGGCFGNPTGQAVLAGGSAFDRSGLACVLEESRGFRNSHARQIHFA